MPVHIRRLLLAGLRAHPCIPPTLCCCKSYSRAAVQQASCRQPPLSAGGHRVRPRSARARTHTTPAHSLHHAPGALQAAHTRANPSAYFGRARRPPAAPHSACLPQAIAVTTRRPTGCRARPRAARSGPASPPRPPYRRRPPVLSGSLSAPSPPLSGAPISRPGAGPRLDSRPPPRARACGHSPRARACGEPGTPSRDGGEAEDGRWGWRPSRLSNPPEVRASA